MFKIYCIKPISGASADTVFSYYERIQKTLTDIGYDVLVPLHGKGEMRTETKFKAHGYENSPMTTNHAIFSRDKFFVQHSDILFANFLGATQVSIGSVMEIAIGNTLGKQIVVCMEKDNIMQHAFVLEAATIVFHTEEESLNYLAKLVHKEF